MTSLQPLADAKGLLLRAQLPDQPFIVLSDARALGQILINLVNNAIKFTDTGSVTIGLDRTIDRELMISVTDTGIGVAESDLSRIFRAFERGVENSADHREGTGLGLHICQKLADLIGARITVETSLDAGSTFAVVFEEAP